MCATLITTNLNENKIWETSELSASPADYLHQVSLYLPYRRQKFLGFGGAFTEAAAYCYQQLPLARRTAFLESYFGQSGLRYSLGRTHINSCDFALGNYACVEDPEDEALATFSTERDDQYLIPMIREAQEVAGKPIGLLLSPWSPPAFMKTNGEMNHGGSLLPAYRARWAACMAKYAAYYRSKGCDVRRISIQNEPAATQTWDSCIYSAEEEGIFAAEFLAPALKEAGCGDIPILAWDHNKDCMVYRVAETLSVPGAAEAISGFGFHWYSGDHFEAVRLVEQNWPDKELWFTEGCVEDSRFFGTSDLYKAEAYAHDIMGNLNAGIVASLDWNLLLDAQGGPNHVGNFCEAPVRLNKDASDFRYQNSYYYIGQFSRYIQPGAVRIENSSYSTELEATTFQNPDGSLATVFLNRTDWELPVSLTQDAKTGYNFALAPHTIATLLD